MRELFHDGAIAGPLDDHDDGTDEGVTVLVSLPRPRGLHDLPADEVVERAYRLAREALRTAGRALEA